MTIDIETTPVADTETPAAPTEVRPDWIHKQQAAIWDRYTAHMNNMVPIAVDPRLAKAMTSLLPGLDVAAMGEYGSQLECVAAVLSYVEGQIAWLKTASLVELQAYDVTTDPNWPNCIG